VPVTLVIVASAVFVLVRVSGDEVAILLPPEATAEQRALLRDELHLNDPPPVQLALFLAQAARLDFGRSLYYQRPAIAVVAERIPATLELAVAAMLVAVLVGVGLGILAGVWEGSPLDWLVTAGASIGQSLPSFWLGILLILLFAVNLHWVPTSGRGTVVQLLMPVATLAAFLIPQILVMAKASLTDVLTDPYVTVARAKGLRPSTVVLRHALPNALNPVVTTIGLQFGALMGGAVITETVFAWPGLGRLGVEAVFNRDLPTVEAAVLVLALGVAVSNIAVDVVNALLDPRIRSA